MILSLVISNLYLEIKNIADLAKEKKLVTKIGLRPSLEIPFPSLVLDRGRPKDPLGFIKYSNDVISEQHIPKEGCHKVVAVVADFKINLEVL